MRFWLSLLSLLICSQLHAVEGVKITMHLETPRESMVLTKDFNMFAEKAKIITTGITWKKDNNNWTLQSNKPFNKVHFILKTSVEVASSYPLISVMNTGDAVLYWPYWQSLFIDSNYNIDIEAAGKHVYIDGEIQKSKLIDKSCRCFILLTNEKKILYFANYRIYFSDNISLHQRAQINKSLNSQLNFYTLNFGELSHPPLFIVNHTGKIEGVSSGDVESRVVYFQFSSSFLNTSAEQILSYNKLLSHEIFHLWHSMLFLDDAEKWVYEGAAEALALKSLAERKELNKQDFLKQVAESVNQCSNFIGGKNLDLLTFDDAVYQCGNLFFSAVFMSDEAYLSIAKLWSQPLNKIRLLEIIVNNVEDETFRQTLEKMIQGEFFIREFPSLFPNALLIDSGNAQATLQERKVACASLFAKVMADDCSGVSFSLSDKGLQVQEAPNCSNIVDGVITKINGLSFPKQCISINDSVVSRCQDQGQSIFPQKELILLGYNDNTQVMVACPHGLSPRAIRYQFR